MNLMNLTIGIALVALLGMGWMLARRVAKKKREQEARRRRRKRRARVERPEGPNTVSQRSDMRSTDSPVSVMDTIQKRPKDGKE